MKFIDKENYSKIKELAKSGDEKAKDFLFNFMSMSDEEAKKIVEEMSFADCGYVSRRAPIFLRIYAVIMLVVIVLVLLLQFIV